MRAVSVYRARISWLGYGHALAGREKQAIMKYPSPFYVTCFASAIASAGCSFAPYDGKQFDHATDPVLFEGCSTSPNSPIAIYASQLNQNGQWGPPQQFGSSTSSSSVSYTDSNGIGWYCWSQNVVIPRDHWGVTSAGALGLGSRLIAAVKVTDNGSPVYSYKNDPTNCTQPEGSGQLTNATPCAIAPQNSFGSFISPGVIFIYASAF